MLRRFGAMVLFCLMVLAVTTVSAQEGSPAVTSGDVNLRTGPGTSYSIIQYVPYGSSITLYGRNEERSWLYVDYNGLRGWMYFYYVSTEGRIQELPVVSADGVTVSEPVSSTTGSTTSAQTESSTTSTPTSAGVVSRITATSRAIFQRGQTMGNRADVFAKVGDSITASPLFLTPIGYGAYSLGAYGNLQDVIHFFSQTGARDNYSFANTSIAARGGFTTTFLLDPQFSPAGICQPGETPLVCEYRNIRPSVALIMIGTNDLNTMDGGTYEYNLRRIMDITIDMGIIPVLSTIPDRPNSSYGQKALAFNNIIRSVSASYDTPLWDYWSALQGLHNQGLSEDNVHPSYNPVFGSTVYFDEESLRYGYNVRNLTALQVLDALWRNVLSQ